MQPYLAMIVPVSNTGDRPDNSLPPGFAGRPDNSLPPGYGGPVDPGYGRPIFHPGHPDHGLPSAPARPDNSLPGSGGGGMPGWGGGWGSGDHPGNRPPGSFDPARPDNSLPGAQPKSSMYAGVPESSIPEHPDKPDPDAQGSWVLVALGDRKVGWAWMEAPAPTAEPK